MHTHTHTTARLTRTSHTNIREREASPSAWPLLSVAQGVFTVQYVSQSAAEDEALAFDFVLAAVMPFPPALATSYHKSQCKKQFSWL